MVNATCTGALFIQDTLRAGETAADVAARYALITRRHNKYPNLVLFKYNQIESPMGDPLVQQCRGLVLDEANNWEVVCRPFDKFFNYGEGHAAPIDWESARVQEKLDGSLMSLYFYDGQWHVATSGTPDASGEVNACGFTFAELFWATFRQKGYSLPFPVHKNLTFMFELMTPWNRVVVRHTSNDLKLIGVRQNINGREFRVAEQRQYEPVREFPLGSLDEIIKSFELIDGTTREGYVVVDEKFHRIKVKHPQYVAIHHMRDGFGPKRILEVIRHGETSELLVHFPEWAQAFESIQSRYDALVDVLEDAYDEWKHIENQKEFALKALTMRCSFVLFALRKGSIQSIKEGLAQMPIANLMDILEIKDIKLEIR